MNYSIHASGRLVSYIMEECPTPEEFGEFLQSVLADPIYQRGFSFLGDCRRSARDLEPSFVRRIAAQLRANAKHWVHANGRSTF